jgi:CHASE2 domain-containing sensor protein
MACPADHGGAVFLITLVIWQLGWLQPIEFALYDLFLQQRPKIATADSPVTIIATTEEDVRHLG